MRRNRTILVSHSTQPNLALFIQLRAGRSDAPGSRAFAHLVLSYPEPGVTISSSALGSEKLHYRQVADPKNPAYFLRNPSRIYGLSNHAFIAEKAYQMVYDFLKDVDPEYPHKMVQV